jgi:hypothetical protein
VRGGGLKALVRRALGLSRSRQACALFVAGGFVLSRILYIGWLGVRFSTEPLNYYLQYIDPALLRGDLLRSLFYLPDQPPAFNFFLGLVLQTFPESYALAFHAAYLALGLAGALGAFFLACRLGCGPRLAVLLAMALFAAPSTVLYEHWLFYAYPVAVLLILVTLGLHRVLRSGARRDVFLAFGALALVVLIRGTFHLAFYLGVLGGVLAARWAWRRSVLIGALVPTLLVCGVYAKHALLYEEFAIGTRYRDVNMYQMQVSYIHGKPARADGNITGVCPVGVSQYTNLDALVRRGGLSVKHSGLALLDDTTTSAGFTNWHSNAAMAVCEACARDSQLIHRHFPNAYWAAVRENVARYVRPAIAGLSYLDPPAPSDAKALRKLKRWIRGTFMFASPGGTSWTVVFGLLVGSVAPMWFLGRWLQVVRRVGWRAARPPGVACIATFTTATLLFSAATVILFSCGDHSRYRAEVMPLVWIVVVATLAALSRFAGRIWQRARVGRDQRRSEG